MTGQVKEDIISRWFELGVSVHDGQISFAPTMLSDADFVNGELRFTYCGTPVLYRKAEDKKIIIETQDERIVSKLSTLNSQLSMHLFARDGQIKQLIIEL